jgi:hypothetical protein
VSTVRAGAIGDTAGMTLEQVLAELEPDLHGLPTGQVTARITDAVHDWAVGNAWSCRAETPVLVPDEVTTVSRRRGLHDLVIDRPGLADLVVEIDRANKRWSAEKLGLAAARGMEAVWIRWSGQPPPPDLVPDGVAVIKLTVRAVRQTSQHPRGWLSRRRQHTLPGEQPAESRPVVDPFITGPCQRVGVPSDVVTEFTEADQSIALKRLAAGLLDLQARLERPGGDVVPYPSNLQGALDAISLIAHRTGETAPISVVELLEWAELPLGDWPMPLVGPDDEKASDALLWFGQPQEICLELGAVRGDVVANARESKIITGVRDLCRATGAPESYVAFRKFLIDHPVVDVLELESAKAAMFRLADALQASYEVPLPEWIDNGVIRTCGTCGGALRMLSRQTDPICVDPTCSHKVRGGGEFAPMQVRVLRREMLKYVGGPGRAEVQLAEQLTRLGVANELWPDFDAYDLRVFDVAPWAVDVKAWRHPTLLAEHLMARPPHVPDGAERMFIVIADEVAKGGYVGAVQAWQHGSSWDQVTVISQRRFVAEVKQRVAMGGTR